MGISQKLLLSYISEVGNRWVSTDIYSREKHFTRSIEVEPRVALLLVEKDIQVKITDSK